MKNVVLKSTLLFLISMSVFLSACTKSSSANEKEEDPSSVSNSGKLSKVTINSNNDYKTIYSFTFGTNGYVSEYTRSTGKNGNFNDRKYIVNYDASDKITSITQAENTVEVKYNNNGQISEYNNLKYEYNAAGQ